jgi:FMN phosphatase YigB (HAD superfamily)
MAKITTIFIDDGGVMSDNSLRPPEWRRLVGEYFAQRLGGNASAWSEANRIVFSHLESMLITGHGQQDYISWFDGYQIRWLREMAAHAGVRTPSDDNECLNIVWDSVDYITQHVHSVFPGATEAIKLLYANGFTLFTSSGEHSRELQGYLKGIGVHNCFKTLYGSDLINYGKYSVEYYRRIFENSHIVLNEVLVVDDKPEYLSWAASLGAKTCLVNPGPYRKSESDFVVSKLAELPAALEMKK